MRDGEITTGNNNGLINSAGVLSKKGILTFRHLYKIALEQGPLLPDRHLLFFDKTRTCSKFSGINDAYSIFKDCNT